MSKEAEYFAENRTPPKWFIGDRVFGKWNKIPFTGTVLNDHIVTEEVGPVVHVYLDLPLKYKTEYKTIVSVKQKDIKKLVNFS
jgi:hypothetical protein